MHTERRRHRRYKVKDNAFAVISPDPVKLVPVVDISMGGLGIYVNEGSKLMDDSPKLEIMVADCSFYLDNLPYEIIENIKAFSGNASNMLNGRRFNLKFGNLRPAQKARLKFFMRNYTHGGSKFQFLRKFSTFLHPTWANKHAEPTCNLGIWQGFH